MTLTAQRNKSNSILLDINITNLIKFLACLLIALHHYSQDMVVAGTHNLIYQLASTQGGWFGVAVFFFLSGYGLMKSDLRKHMPPLSFFKKRLIKTYVPAVIVSILWGTYSLMVANNSINVSWIIGIFWNFNDEILWFVRAILFLYVAFYIYAAISQLNSFRKFTILRILLMIAILSLTIFLMYPNIVGFINSSSTILFFVGMSIAEYDFIYLKLIKKVYPVILCYTAIIVLTVIYRHEAEWIHLLINYFLILSSIVLFAMYEIRISRLPKWVGGCSYDIYLVHNKALMILRSMYTIVPFWLFTVIAAIFTIIFYNLRKALKL